jgi:hypothetical protein
MFRKVVGAVFVLSLCLGIAVAEEIRAVITKVEGGKVTFAETKGKGEKGSERTLPVAANLKVLKGKFNQDTKKLEAGEAVEGGLKHEMFSKIGEKGLRATVITDADNKTITEIRVGGRGRRGKQ